MGAVAALAFASAAGVGMAADYTIDEFEFPAAPITGARGLDDDGCVAGYYQTDPTDVATAHALRRCDGTLETVDPPDSVGDRRAFDVNSSGVLVGAAHRNMAGLTGFELSASVYTWVEYPGADLTVLRGVNDLGDVVGEYENADAIRHAFARVGGVFSNVDVPGAVHSRARGINSSGHIVGHFDDGAGDRHGFLRSPTGGYTTIDVPGAAQTLAGGINDAGDIVGTWFDGAGAPHGFVLGSAGLELFDVPGTLGTFTTGINEAGQLAGELLASDGVRRGFVATPVLFADGFESGDLQQWSGSAPEAGSPH